MVLQSTRGEHARERRERVIEIANLDTGAWYEGCIRRVNKIFHRTCYATLFCFRDGDNLPLTVISAKNLLLMG